MAYAGLLSVSCEDITVKPQHGRGCCRCTDYAHSATEDSNPAMKIVVYCALLLHIAVTSTYGLPSLGGTGPSNEVEYHQDADMETKKWTRCGERLCHCRQITAKCSRIPGGLQYLPPLPSHVQDLYFSYNQLRVLTADFFKKAPRLIKVDLSHNNLSYISPKAFQPLPGLRYLFLSANPDLNYTTLSPAFKVPTLEELDIMSCQLGPLPPRLFHNTSLSNLTILMLHDNDVGDLKMSTFRPLVSLEELGLATNSISKIHVDHRMKSLRKINLDSNQLYDFPPTCTSNQSSLFPRLRLLLLQGNSLSFIPQTVCLPSVQVLALGENHFSHIETGSFSKNKFPSLVQVSLFSMHTLISHIGKNAFRNPTLQRIDLAFNGIQFRSSNIHNDSFAGCPHLYNLELAENRLDIDEDRFVTLFGHLHSVSLVDMQYSRLQQLSPRMLFGFRNLTRLHLSRNEIPVLKGGLFHGLTHLQRIDLSQNQISIVSPSAFTEPVRDRLRSLNLSGNPFSCSCDLMWFQGWLNSNKSLFNSWTQYNCGDIPGVQVQQFSMAEQACLLTHNTYVMIVVITSLLISTVTVVSLLTRYRWHLRLLVYDAFRARGDARRRLMDHGQFDYDVFVCYDIFDDPWVRKHLCSELEQRLGLRLCLQERDLDPAVPELQSISESLERSKKVIMLFSTSFAQSPMCQFELSMCVTHVLDQGDALIIACLDDLPARAMTSSMMAVLKTTPYIQWADDEDAVAAFWGRLDLALQDIISHRHQ